MFNVQCSFECVFIPDCTNSAIKMYFDKIFISSSSSEKFQCVVPYLETFMTGESVCVIAHGITGIYIYTTNKF